MIRFGKYFRATFLMKSGSKMTFNCSKLNIKKVSTIQSYEVFGAPTGDVFYVDINEIEAITYKKKYGFWIGE